MSKLLTYLAPFALVCVMPSLPAPPKRRGSPAHFPPPHQTSTQSAEMLLGGKEAGKDTGRQSSHQYISPFEFIEFVIKGVVREREHLKSEPIVDTGERKIKLNQQGESKREPCPPFNIKSRNVGASEG